MPNTTEEALAAVADAIKRYLDAHPNVADSVEGIVHWWLTRQRLEDATEVVEEALERLAAKGEVTKTITGEGKILYSRIVKKS